MPTVTTANTSFTAVTFLPVSTAPLVVWSPVVPTTLLWVCDAGGVLLSDPLLWAHHFQVPPETVSGRSWLSHLHSDDVPLVETCFVSLLNPCDSLPTLALDSRSLVIRLREGQAYARYQLQAAPVLLQDSTYHWVFWSFSLEPTASDYAERNLLSVLTMAVSLARAVLQSVDALHNETLRPPLCRRLNRLTDQIYGYLDHVEQGVRYLSSSRRSHD